MNSFEDALEHSPVIADALCAAWCGRLLDAISRHCDRTLAANREPTAEDLELWALVKEGA